MLVLPVVLRRVRVYWELVKGFQTGLLVFTGMAGFATAQCPYESIGTVLALVGSLLLAVTGCTVLNMVWDRDIDARMGRTRRRPLPSGRVTSLEAGTLGLVLTVLGLTWAWWLSPVYGAVVTAGVVFDLLVYTIWLKRRTPWSVVWGGIAGGMPALAGRVLGTGEIDLLGVLLALAVLLWIPTHIMTFSIKYAADYQEAGVPVFPNTHGLVWTQRVILLSTIAAAITMASIAVMLCVPWGYLRVSVLLGAGLVATAAFSVLRPSLRWQMRLFKLASLYMLASMGLMGAGLWF